MIRIFRNSLLTIFLLFIISSNKVFSQNYLELRKATKLNYFSIYPGENIRFKKKNDDFFTSARITSIDNKNLIFNNIEVPINEIQVIDIRSKTSNFGKNYGTVIAGGSMGYFIVDFINLSIVQRANYKDVFNQNILISCSIGFSIGIILRSFAKRKYFKRNELNRIWVQESF